MKAKYIVLVLALASVFCACNRDEKDLFDDRAAVRAQKALENAFDVLTAPVNGWEMIYFANPTSAGYNVLVTFNKDGSVTATAKNEATTGNKIQTDSSSTWGVINDYGPILTFDTYNKVLHAWADPQSDGDGYLGDYEFLILHAEQGYVKLKGKKHSAYCYLYPLAIGITQDQYFASVETLNARMFGNSNLLHAKSGGQEYLLYGGASGMFIRTATGSTPDVETDPAFPLAVRQNGIQLMVPIFDNGNTKYELQSAELTDGSSTIYASAPLAYFKEYFDLAQGRWSVDITEINETTMAAIEAVNAALRTSYPKSKKAGILGLKFKKMTDHFELVLRYYGSSSTSATEMNYLYSIATSGNSLHITYNGAANENAQKVLNAFPDLLTIFQSLDGVFALITNDAINPSNGCKLTNNANSSIWFNITGTVE